MIKGLLQIPIHFAIGSISIIMAGTIGLFSMFFSK